MSTNWRREQAKIKRAVEFGEQVALESGFSAPPIDPFVVIKNEKGRIQAFGDDFGNAFDGRLEYQHPKFLLFYNTKFDQWAHDGQHHPKVLFTIGHELGHYFHESHRQYLTSGGGPHGSVTEFESNHIVEREADGFSSGLLMPKYLLRKIVNRSPPTLDAIKLARDQFAVSLTSMLVRWVQLCDFPCAVASVRAGKIEWGFCSPGFKRANVYRVNRGAAVSSRDAQAFIGKDASFSEYRNGEGYSDVSRWFADCDRKFGVTEEYLVVASTRQMLVFLTADEDDVVQNRFYD